MLARVRTDKGEHSEWFDATQGLRQGCLLSPLLLKVLFAAAIHFVLVRFIEDESIVQKIVHLDDDRAGRDDESLACV